MRTISILIIVFIWATGLSKAGLITNITATDDGHYNSYTATKAVDGSGLYGTSSPFQDHHAEGNTYSVQCFLSNNSKTPTLIFDLGSIKTLDSIHIWNYNDDRTNLVGYSGTTPFGPYKNFGRGIHSVDILLSSTDTNGASFTTWKSGVIFPDAPGSESYTGFDLATVTDSISGQSARYVKFKVNNNWKDSGYTGLAEVRFYESAGSSGAATPAINFGSPAVSNITVNTAWINGTLTSTGAAATTVSVYWGPSDAGTNTGAAWAHTNIFPGTASTLPSNYTYQVTTPDGSTNYFNYYAQNASGGVWAAATAFSYTNTPRVLVWGAGSGGGGDGQWDTAVNWTGNASKPAAYNDVVFDATGSSHQTVILTAGGAANRLTFSVAGYTLTGGSLTNGAITATENATIASSLILYGNATWAITAGKTLTLSSLTNTVASTLTLGGGTLKLTPSVVSGAAIDLRTLADTTHIKASSDQGPLYRPWQVSDGVGCSSFPNYTTVSYTQYDTQAWESGPGSQGNHWIEWDLGAAYTISKMHVWQTQGSAAQAGFIARDIKTFTLQTASSAPSDYGGSGTWVNGQAVTFTSQATSSTSDPGFDYNLIAPVTTRFLRFNAISSFSDTNYVGLNEIVFYQAGSAGSVALPSLTFAATADSTLDLGGASTTNTLAGLTAAGGATLTVTNSASLNITNLTIMASGATCGRVVVKNGTLSLSNTVTHVAATLTVSGTSTEPSITLISAASPVNGTFEGLPEGAPVSVGAMSYMITYAGGAGFDVVLEKSLPSPRIRNLPATDITGNSASLNGNLTSTGALATAVWVFWGPQNCGTNGGPTPWAHTNSFGTNSIGPTTYTTTVASLAQGTTYYYNFYAENASGGVWAGVTNFTTQISAPHLAPDDSRISYTDYARLVTLNASTARFDRILVGAQGSLERANPAARIRIRTDATNVTASFITGALGITRGVGAILVDGVKTGTFNASANNSGVDVNLTLGGGFHTVEYLMPYSQEVLFTGLTVNVGAAFTTTPARPGTRWVAYGDSITEGFEAGDSYKNYPSLVGAAKNWEVVNMGFGWRGLKDSGAGGSDGTVIGGLGASIITVLTGYNDAAAGVTAATYRTNLAAFVTQIRLADPKVPIYLISPIYSANNQTRLGEYRTEIMDYVNTAHDPRVFFIDGLTLGINAGNAGTYLTDGIHPNDAGFAVIAGNLGPQLLMPWPVIANGVQAPTYLTATAATVYGDLQSTGRHSTAVWVLYDTVNRGTNSPSAWVYTNTVLGADVPPGITNVTLDLSAFPQTNWWYVFYATNAAGPAWGGAPILFKADTVGDGIPDWWRSRYFGAGATTNDASCATADPDKDGRDNLQEWISMTIPTNQASVLRFSGVLTPGPTIGLRFDSTTAREYSILGRTNLTWGSWFPVTNGVRGTDGLMTIELDVSSGTNSMFYRLDASIP